MAKLLAKNTKLIALSLDYNNISDDGALALAKNRNLITLSLNNNNIGDDGASALAANKTLIELSFQNNDIGLKAIKAFSQNKTLVSLALRLWHPYAFGDDIAFFMGQNTSIKTLDISWSFLGFKSPEENFDYTRGLTSLAY